MVDGDGDLGVVVHTLRHSAAVAWLEAAVHIKAVADLLGHASIARDCPLCQPGLRHLPPDI